MNLGEHFLLLAFFDNINLKINLYSKVHCTAKLSKHLQHSVCSIFKPILKIQSFPMSMLILGKNLANFIPPA